MNILLSGEEVIQQVYEKLVDRYNPERLTLPEPTSVFAGKANVPSVTSIVLTYQEFAVFQFKDDTLTREDRAQETYWVIGKGEQTNSKIDEGYTADLLGIRLKNPDLTAQDLMRALPRCSKLSQSLLQASTSGALVFDSRLSQFIASRAKEIVSEYLVHTSSRQHQNLPLELRDLEFLYLPERIISGSMILPEEIRTDDEDQTVEQEPRSNEELRLIRQSMTEEKRKIEKELSGIIADCLRAMRH